MSCRPSVSAATSFSAVSKKTRVPSAEAPLGKASNTPLPLTWPAATRRVATPGRWERPGVERARRPAGALGEVVGGSGVAGDELLRGAEEDARSVDRAAGGEGVER